MRLMSHILAVVLAITAIAVPCLANVQGPYGVVSQHHSQTVKDNDKCSGPCTKAIVSRESDLERVAVVETVGFDPIVRSVEKTSYPITKHASVVEPTKALCVRSVDLHVLCRLLN